MKRFEEIRESFIFLFRDYSSERKNEIKGALANYKFEKRKKDDLPHANSFEVNGNLSPPSNEVEAIFKIMNPYYNADTANKIRTYILDNLS